MEKHTRPRTRRAQDSLLNCQDCLTNLCDANWTPSMQKYKRYICKFCWTARQKRYNKADPELKEKRREQTRKRKESWSPERKAQESAKAYSRMLGRRYSLTIEQYQDLLGHQGGCCAICCTETPTGRGGFHVDHCHQTEQVRGLLCSQCNMMLGLAKDDPEILERAKMYLADHKKENRQAEGGKSY